MPRHMNCIARSRAHHAFSRLAKLGRWAGGFAAGIAAALSCARPLEAPPNKPEPSVTVRPEARGLPSSVQVPVGEADAVWGNVNAPVTLVAFLDFECPFCALAHPTVVDLLHKYGTEKVRLVVKHAPLPFHQRGLPAAKAAQAVLRLKGVDPFLSYVAALYRDVSARDEQALTDARLVELAVGVGAERDAFTKEFVNPEGARKVAMDLQLYDSLGLSGVPAFLVNGALITGARPSSDFETLIEHELAAAEELVRRGVEVSDLYERRVQVNYRPAREFDEQREKPFEDVAYQVPLGTSPARGPSDAPITIVEFADFECPFCERAHATIEQLIVKYPGKVRWVMKNNPLSFHPVAVPAAITALEVRRQKGDEAYFKVLDQFYGAEELTPDVLLAAADAMGVAPKPLLALFESETLPPELQADQDLAIDLNAQGTPQFFVNGRRLSGAQPLEVFDELVQQELTKVADAKLTGDIYGALQAQAAMPPGLSHHDVPASGPEAPVLGPADAPVTIHMFADFECPFCQRVLPTLSVLRQRYPGKIKLVWRHLPLPFHPHAKQAAAASIEARAQRGDVGFWQMAERLMVLPGVFSSDGKVSTATKLPELPELSPDFLREQAKAMGLDEAKFVEAMNGGAHHDAIALDAQLARKLGVSGTPAFFVNGYALSGAQPLERFERLVRLALTPTAGDKSPRAELQTVARPK